MAKQIGEMLNGLLDEFSPTTSRDERSDETQSELTTTSDSRTRSSQGLTLSSKSGAIGKDLTLAEMVPAETLTREVFIRGMGELGACIGVKYSQRDPESGELTGDSVKARKLYEILKERGWSASQFQARLNDFIASNPFKGWSPADFLNDQGDPVEPVALHPYSWYLEQCDAGKGDAVECYVSPDGRRGWGWIHELEDVLERYVVDEQQVRTLPEAPEPIQIGADDDWLRGRAALDRELKLMEARDRIRDLERKLEEQRRQVKRYEARIEEDDEIIGTLQNDLARLLEGKITIDEYELEIEERANA